MTNVSDKILDKLRKLMELAERGDENEAKLAAQRAAELMAKHQIDAAQVMASSPSAKVTVERGRIDAEEGADTSRVEAWHKALGATIAESFGARMWLRGKGRDQQFFIVGPPDSVSSVRYMYLSLSKQVNRLARTRARELGETQNAWRRAYCLGMVVRVAERLQAGRKQAFAEVTTTAMVWVDKQKQAVDDALAEMSLKNARNFGPQKRPDAGSFGYKDGDKVDVGGTRNALGEGRKELKA